jgi:beta-glucosidase
LCIVSDSLYFRWTAFWIQSVPSDRITEIKKDITMNSAPYHNAALSIDGRIIDLLPRMTLKEKCAQLIGPFHIGENDGTFSFEFARQRLMHGISYVGTHHLKRKTRETVRYLNAMQKFLREETRLGIPALGIGEGLHGYMAHEATSFPQAIGLASAWDVDLHQRVFGVVAREMRARGAHYVLSPVLDLARDPRWGRTEETYGEDPYLVSQLGVAAVRGLQGERFRGDPEHVLATAKHFAAHGQPEAGTNAGPANYAERMLREELFAPFEAVVREAKIGSVMASYNEINGIPSHVNSWLLRDLLREEWGFEGFVISDGWGVDDLYRLHFVAADEADAAEKSFSSGVSKPDESPQKHWTRQSRKSCGLSSSSGCSRIPSSMKSRLCPSPTVPSIRRWRWKLRTNRSSC